jgi:hypothetical protein
MLRIDDVEAAGAARLRVGGASFCGGTGGSSTAGGVGAPKGPSGSSTASRRVGCAVNGRLRDPRTAGERTAAAVTLGTELAVDFEDAASVIQLRLLSR